jgi:hypothetical protein
MAALLALAIVMGGQHQPHWSEGKYLERALDAKEAELYAIDLDSDEITFGFFRSWEGFSILFKVYRTIQTCDGPKKVKIAVFKTSTGNTYANGEVAVYRLGRYLGVNIYPVTIPMPLGPVAAKRLLRMLKKKNYGGNSTKEPRRLKVIGQLKNALRGKTTFVGAFKEWVNGFHVIFSPGFENLPSRWRMKRYLGPYGSAKPPKKAAYFHTNDKMFNKEKGYYTATMSLDQLGRDLSNMMVIDALTGQTDRWPGGNLHYRLFSGGPFKKIRHRRFKGGPARLLSLDNGGVLRYAGSGLVYLRRAIWRFDKRVASRLDDLSAWIARDAEAARRYLTINERAFGIFQKALARTRALIAERTKNRPDRWL